MGGKRFYDPGLDIVRFIACALVLFHHIVSRCAISTVAGGGWFAKIVQNAALGGGLGVIYFYTLSAFLLSKLLILEHEGTGTIATSKFWARRCLRIWPLYFFYLGVLALIGAAGVRAATLPGGWRTGSLVVFLYNWFDWQPGAASSLAAILWSVCLEEQFYVLLIAVVALLGVKRLPVASCVMIAAGVASRAFVLQHEYPYPAIWKFTTSHLDAFGAGILAACLLHRRTPSVPAWVRIPVIALALASPAGLAAWFGMGAYAGWSAVGGYLWCALMTIALIATVGGAPKSDGGTWHSLRRVMIYLGRRAYGLYVYHWFALEIVPLAMRGSPPAGPLTPLEAVSVIGATLVLAAASYRWVEKPFLRWKRSFEVVHSAPVV